MLRAALAHNQSDRNGYSSQKVREDYALWVLRILGKKEPETLSDYVLLNNELKALYQRMIHSVYQMLQMLKSQGGKAKIVREWIGIILNWYCNNTRRDIYFGCLINEYLARAQSKGSFNISGTETRTLRYYVNQWIERALTKDLDNEIHDLEKNIESSERALSMDSEIARVLWSSLPEQEAKVTRERMQSNIRESQIKLEQAKNKREEYLEQIDRQGVNNVFFKVLGGENGGLRSTMRQLEEEGISYTMLPQELIMYDIDHRFHGVASPMGDF